MLLILIDRTLITFPSNDDLFAVVGSVGNLPSTSLIRPHIQVS